MAGPREEKQIFVDACGSPLLPEIIGINAHVGLNPVSAALAEVVTGSRVLSGSNSPGIRRTYWTAFFIISNRFSDLGEGSFCGKGLWVNFQWSSNDWRKTTMWPMTEHWGGQDSSNYPSPVTDSTL